MGRPFRDATGPMMPTPYQQRPYKNAVWYGSRPHGKIFWEGPGWYGIAAKNTRLIKVA